MKMDMKKHLTAVGFALAVLIVLAGCGGAVKYPNYYTLHLPPPPDPPAPENVRATLAVREFRSPVYLRQGAIVYKTSPEQIGFYNYHRWAVDPREFLTNAVADRLRASGNFSQVRSYTTDAPTSITFSADASKNLRKSTTKVASKSRLQSPPRW